MRLPAARTGRLPPAMLDMRMPTPRTEFVPFRGGMDTETPSLQVGPGTAFDAVNYELGVESGYIDTMGYERVDGRAAPSAATYYTLDVTFGAVVNVGDAVTGGTSGATGVVLAVADAMQLILTAVTGTWVTAENVLVSAVAKGVTTTAALERGASTGALDVEYVRLAADHYRSLIAAAPGEGNILGGFWFNSINYTFRNAVGGASAKMHKTTGSGWTEVALGRELAFTSGGTYEIAVGNTITGATSGATAVVTGVALRSGSWASGDAAGVLVFASQTGTFQSENLNVGANPNVSTIAGNSSAITLPAGGRYETVECLFSDTSSNRVYGVNGVGRAFSFDGATFIPITTSGTDTPAYIAAFNQALVTAHPGGIIRVSPVGRPYVYSVTLLASEFRIGAECTGLMVEPGSEGNGALLLCSRNRLWMLYGTDSGDYNLVQYREAVGAYAHTLGQMGYTIFLDDVGVTSYRTTQAYGNFAHAAITQHIRSWLNPKRMNASAALTVRNKNQYRLFFTDGHVLTITFAGGKPAGCMPLYYPDQPLVVWKGEDANGDEVLFFGSDNGHVYQMERGTSFDGAVIQSYVELHPVRMAAPEYVTAFHNWILESRGDTYAEWMVGYRLDYGSPDRLQPEEDLQTVASFQDAVRWDSPAPFWDAASVTWDGASAQPSTSVRLRGSGENIILTLSKSSAAYGPVRHSGGSIRHTVRRLRT